MITNVFKRKKAKNLFLIFIATLLVVICLSHFLDYALAQSASETPREFSDYIPDFKQWEWYHFILTPVLLAILFYILRGLLGALSIISMIGGVAVIVLHFAFGMFSPLVGVYMFIGGLVGNGIFKAMGGKWASLPYDPYEGNEILRSIHQDRENEERDKQNK